MALSVDQIIRNGKIVSEERIEKDSKGIGSGLIQCTIPDICVDGQNKLEKSPSVYLISSLRF